MKKSLKVSLRSNSASASNNSNNNNNNTSNSSNASISRDRSPLVLDVDDRSFDRSFSRHINYDLPETKTNSKKDKGHTSSTPLRDGGSAFGSGFPSNFTYGSGSGGGGGGKFPSNVSNSNSNSNSSDAKLRRSSSWTIDFRPPSPSHFNSQSTALENSNTTSVNNNRSANKNHLDITHSTTSIYSSNSKNNNSIIGVGSSDNLLANYDNSVNYNKGHTMPHADLNGQWPSPTSQVMKNTSEFLSPNSAIMGATAQAAVSAAVMMAARKEKSYNRFVALPDISKPGGDARPNPNSLPLLEDSNSTWMKPTPDKNQTSLGTCGRISVYCTAGAYYTKRIRYYLTEKYRDTRFDGEIPVWYHEAMYARYVDADGRSNDILGDIFYFDYGVVVMWGLTRAQEADVLTELSAFESVSLDTFEVQVDQFELRFSAEEQPRIHNDIITINNLEDHQCKLAISHALSQSTKLCVFEGRIEQTIESSKHVPGDLATTGKVHLSRIAISKKIGHLFMQKSAVNLLSDVLDTPEFFWSAPDHLQALYKAARQYMEINVRVEVLNTRLMVLQDMLEMLKEQQNQLHSEKLEWIVIFLIGVEIIVGIAGIFVDLFRVNK